MIYELRYDMDYQRSLVSCSVRLTVVGVVAATWTFQSFAGEEEKNYFEDVDEDETENAEMVHGLEGLPYWVVGVEGCPDGHFR